MPAASASAISMRRCQARPSHRSQLCRPRVATMRRVVGAQRGVAQHGGMEGAEHRRARGRRRPRSAPCRAAGRATPAAPAARAAAAATNQAWKVRISTGRPRRGAARGARASAGSSRTASSGPMPRIRELRATRCLDAGLHRPVGEPAGEAVAHLAGRGAGEGDGEDLVRLDAVEQQRAAMRDTSIQVLPEPAQASTTHAARRVAGGGVEAIRRDPRAVDPQGRACAHRRPSPDRRQTLNLGLPVVATAQAARVAVLAHRALAERAQRRAVAQPRDVDGDALDQRAALASTSLCRLDIERLASTRAADSRHAPAGRSPRPPARRRRRAACPRSRARALLLPAAGAAGLVVDQLERPRRRRRRPRRCDRRAVQLHPRPRARRSVNDCSPRCQRAPAGSRRCSHAR